MCQQLIAGAIKLLCCTSVHIWTAQHVPVVQDARSTKWRMLLRARFGLSQRQAKDKLIHLKRDNKVTLHEQGMEVLRLVELAYPRLSRMDREQMGIDHLLQALDNKGIQRHMLTIQPQTVVELVQAVDEYLAVGGTRHSTFPSECQGRRG